MNGCKVSEIKHAQIKKAITEHGIVNLNAHLIFSCDFRPGASWRAVKCGRKIYGIKVERDSRDAALTVFDPSYISIYDEYAPRQHFPVLYFVGMPTITRELIEHADKIAAAEEDFRRVARAAGLQMRDLNLIE